MTKLYNDSEKYIMNDPAVLDLEKVRAFFDGKEL